MRLLTNPSVLPNLSYIDYKSPLPEKGGILEFTEEEIIEFLRVRGRMKGMRYLRLTAEARNVVRVIEELAAEETQARDQVVDLWI